MLITQDEQVVTFITEAWAFDTVGNPTSTNTTATAYAKIRSIGAKEYFGAGSEFPKPEAILDVFRWDYNDQRKVMVNGEEYEIYRAYADGDLISLYITRGNVNV